MSWIHPLARGILFLLFVAATVPSGQATNVNLHIQAWLDGHSFLHISDDLVWWDQANSATFARPGQYNHHDKPTYLNGHVWTPEWTTATGSTPSALDHIGVMSTRGFSVVQFKVVKARGTAALAQSPANPNWETILEFNDEAHEGADWYDVTVVFSVPDATCDLIIPLGCPFGYFRKSDGIFQATVKSTATECVAACCDVDPLGVNSLAQSCQPVLNGWGHSGNDVAYTSATSAQQCCTLCATWRTQGKNCQYWTFTGTMCYGHSKPNLAPRTGYVAGYQAPTIHEDECDPVLDGWSHMGNDVGNTFTPDALSCCQFCKSIATCKFWTWTKDRHCYAHSKANLVTGADKVGYKASYVRPLVDEDQCGPILTGWSNMGNDISYTATPDAASCCAYCKSIPISETNPEGCKVWTWTDKKLCYAHRASHLVAGRPGYIASYSPPVVLPSQCTPTNAGCYYDGHNVGNMATPTAAGCCSFCTETPNCASWSWDPVSKACWIHDKNAPLRSRVGMVCGTYVPRPTVPSHQPHKCQGRWIEVTGECTMPCNTGEKLEQYVVIEPAKYGGEDCEALHGQHRFVPCNRKPCPADCVGKWYPAQEPHPTTCSKTCGWGVLALEYVLVKPAEEKGRGCEHRIGKIITKPCFVQKCPVGVVTSSSSSSVVEAAP